MADGTSIEWTDATWNPTVGCTVISPGCTNCYAMRMAERLKAMGRPEYRGMTMISKAGPVWTGDVGLASEAQLLRPLSWRKPRRVFVNSMSDLFYRRMERAWIDAAFAVMALAPQHTFQLLTKRPARAADYTNDPATPGRVQRAACQLQLHLDAGLRFRLSQWPLPNVWLGASAEDQPRADERLPALRESAAVVRFISYEPALGPLDIMPWIGTERVVDWVICGGESGPGARMMQPHWARQLRDQCAAAGVPFFFKQWGAWAPAPDVPGGMRRIGKAAAGALLDGRKHREFPA